jgi:hypothetical protein
VISPAALLLAIINLLSGETLKMGFSNDMSAVKQHLPSFGGANIRIAQEIQFGIILPGIYHSKMLPLQNRRNDWGPPAARIQENCC